jgi:hypothetical protein
MVQRWYKCPNNDAMPSKGNTIMGLPRYTYPWAGTGSASGDAMETWIDEADAIEVKGGERGTADWINFDII